MKNKEKYKEKLIDMFVVNGKQLAVKKETGEPCDCDHIFCIQCLFDDNDNKYEACIKARKEWLEAEYIESPVDWSRVAIDTPILVKRRMNGLKDILPNTKMGVYMRGAVVQHHGVLEMLW